MELSKSLAQVLVGYLVSKSSSTDGDFYPVTRSHYRLTILIDGHNGVLIPMPLADPTIAKAQFSSGLLVWVELTLSQNVPVNVTSGASITLPTTLSLR